MTDTLTGFTPYEYRTLQVAPEQEPLYKDTFANFGWIVEKETAGRPGTTTMALQVKRDRRLPNRQVINELQRQAEDALGTIRDLERSRSAAAITVAVALGIVGSAFLAGSVFALTAGLVILSVPRGALGLLAARRASSQVTHQNNSQCADMCRYPPRICLSRIQTGRPD